MFPIVDDQGLLLKLEGGKIWLLEVSLKSPLFLLSGFYFFLHKSKCAFLSEEAEWHPRAFSFPTSRVAMGCALRQLPVEARGWLPPSGLWELPRQRGGRHVCGWEEDINDGNEGGKALSEYRQCKDAIRAHGWIPTAPKSRFTLRFYTASRRPWAPPSVVMTEKEK